MTGAGYPHSSAISGGRRWLSLFLLAVFLPLLFPAEVWASLTRPQLPEPYPFMVPVGSGFAPVGEPGFPSSQPAIYRVTLTRTAPDAIEVTVAPEPLCTQAAAGLLGPGTGKTPIRAPDLMPKNAWAVFSNFQNVQILEVSQSVATQCFVTGDDILGQSSGGNTAWLLYDGHGSTRALANSTGALTARYSYDAYGMMLGGDPSLSKPAATDMLYSGEQFDPGLQQQYLRARYYDQKAGVFASLDPFEGNNTDPQSLHKYAYCHGDGVNGVDPTGLFTLIEVLVAVAIIAVLAVPVVHAVAKARRNALARLYGHLPAIDVAVKPIVATNSQWSLLPTYRMRAILEYTKDIWLQAGINIRWERVVGVNGMPPTVTEWNLGTLVNGYYGSYTMPLVFFVASVYSYMLGESVAGLGQQGGRGCAVAWFLDQIPDYAYARTVAHELGHVFDLVHESAEDNLMAPGTSGTKLSQRQTRQAKGNIGYRRGWWLPTYVGVTDDAA